MALENYRCPPSSGEQNPVPLPYIKDPEYSSYEITLLVSCQGENMDNPEVISKSNYSNMYWNARQQGVI